MIRFDKLLLREPVNHHEQDEFREWLSARPISSSGLLQLFPDQPERGIKFKIIGLAIGTRGIVYLKSTVIKFHLAARAALFLECS